MLRRSLIAIALLVTPAASLAASTRFSVGDRAVDTSRLRPGIYRYLRYEIHGTRRTARDIWQRSISYEMKDGRRLLHMTQRWDEANPPPDGASVIEQDSWFDPLTFAPITHIRRATTAAGIVVSGFRFTSAGALGLKDLPDNRRKDFSLSYAELPFNFEYDMELLQTLPLRAGLDADIPFYDAGIDAKADRYHFKVAGSGRITGWDRWPEECWVVTADYNSGTVRSRFWFDKRSQVLVREEASLPDGGTLVKTLLAPEAGEAAE